MVAMTLPAKPWTNGMMTADGTRMFDSTVGSEGAWRATPIPAGGLPAGSIIQWASNTAPPNWFICDGSAVSRALWPSLFAVIGTTYGAGDGSTTFNLPDLRGRVAVGKNAGTFGTLGGVGGAETQSHAHWTVLGNPSGTPYTHLTMADSTGAPAIRSKTSVNRRLIPEQSYLANTTTYESATYDATTSNLQPYLVTNYIIKATTGWSAGDSELALRMAAAETAAATTNKSGLVPIIPSSVFTNVGTASVSSTGVVTVSNGQYVDLRSCFSSQYRNYKAILKIDRSVVGGYINAKLLSGATPSSASYRTRGIYQMGGSTTAVWADDSATSGVYFGPGAGDMFIVVDISTPFTTNRTNFTFQTAGYLTNEMSLNGAGWHDSMVSYDGLQIYAFGSGTFNGTIQIYGYR